MQSPRELRKTDTRNKIKQAALDIVDREGWQGVTIRKIADLILYTPPIVYEHFKNKEDLYMQLVKEGFNTLSEDTFKKVKKGKDSEEKLLLMAEARYEFYRKYKTLHHMMFDADAPEWKTVYVLNSMKDMKKHVSEWLTDVAGNETKTDEYFLNLICLIRGYTFFAGHMEESDRIRMKFKPGFRKKIKPMYLSAVDRFIQSIKQKS